MKKIFLEERLSPGEIFRVEGAIHKHFKANRIRPGEIILAGDGSDKEFTARIKETGPDYTELEVTGVREAHKPSRDVTMYVSLPKKSRFEDIIYKCTQIGISEFIPMTSARTVVRVKSGRMGRTEERWRSKAQSGAELAAREKIPSIGAVMSFAEALEDFSKKGYGSGILFWEEEEGGNLVRAEDLDGRIAVFIGPEGGFTGVEARQAMAAGFRVRSLGKFVMDVETASIAAAAKVLIEK